MFLDLHVMVLKLQPCCLVEAKNFPRIPGFEGPLAIVIID